MSSAMRLWPSNRAAYMLEKRTSRLRWNIRGVDPHKRIILRPFTLMVAGVISWCGLKWCTNYKVQGDKPARMKRYLIGSKKVRELSLYMH